MRRRAAVVCSLLVALLGGTGALASPGGAKAPRPSVVVAVADTGVNPYHEVYRRPGNTAHPCTWVAGFRDCSVPALRLTLRKGLSYEDAVAADREVWADVEPHQWYWIPGTNIIGAVCDTKRGGDAAAVDPTCILDDDGHGTGTTSAVLSEAPDALLLVHDGKSDALDLPRAPVAPDVQSHSWGPAAPVPFQVADPVRGPEEGMCRASRAFPQSLFFLAAGNEAPVPSVLDCDRHRPEVEVVGGSFPGYWNWNSWSTYDFASWMCRPVALHDQTAGTRSACGTSFSAPTAAGTAAQALLRLRAQDRWTGRSTGGQVTPSVPTARFRQALRDAATYAPDPKYPMPLAECSYLLCALGIAPLPPQAPHLFWGYGWLDGTVVDAVVACARGRSCPAKSPEAQEWNARRQELRGATSRAVLPASAQADAGSARDAGPDRATAVPVLPGRDYDARVEPYVVAGDVEDWYLFRGRAGQRLSVTAAARLHPDLPADPGAVVGCWVVLDSAGRVVHGHPGVALITAGCASPQSAGPPTDLALPETGTYALVYSAHNGLPAHDYRFRLGLTG